MAATVEVVIEGRDNFSSTLGNFGNIMTGISSAVHLAGDALRAFTGFAMAGLDAIASYERIGAALDTLVAIQLVQNGVAVDMAAAYKVSADEAERLLQWVQEVAIHSPFTQEGVADALRMAMAYGFTTTEAQRLTQALIDFAAGSGASEDAMSRIALALGQIEARGKLSGQEIMQLVNAGLPVVQILADAFGVTTAEIVKMQEKGLIPAKEAIEALTVYLETNFAGAAERQSLTWAGLLGTFEDLKAMGLREFFGGLFDAIQPMAVALAEWLQGSGMELIGEWGAKLGEFTTNAVNGLRVLIGTFYEMQDVFEQDGIGGVLDALLGDEFDTQTIVDWLDELDAQLAGAVMAQDWTASGDAFGQMIGQILGQSVESADSQAAPALGQAISDFFLAAAGVADWTEFKTVFLGILDEFVLQASIDWFRDASMRSHLAWVEFWSNALDLSFLADDIFEPAFLDIADGVRQGFSEGWDSSMQFLEDTFRLSFEHLIDIVKDVFGISSPSTVFAQIGRDVIAGLMGGFASMISPLIALIDNVVSAILDPFDPILELLGLSTGGTGTTGSHTTTPTSPTSPTSPTGSGAVVNQYFAGATINVGSWDEIAYDCIYPNPFIAATAGQLGTSSGGGTGAPR